MKEKYRKIIDSIENIDCFYDMGSNAMGLVQELIDEYHEHDWKLYIDEYTEDLRNYIQYMIVCECGERREIEEVDP